MNDSPLHLFGKKLLQTHSVDIEKKDKAFAQRFFSHLDKIESLFNEIYVGTTKRNAAFNDLLNSLILHYQQRPLAFKNKDEQKAKQAHWFLSNQITGMSLYVDRFAGNLKGLNQKLSYFKELGVNFLHLMPLFESPAGESDGGYAVSNFRKVDAKFGTNEDLENLVQKMNQEQMYLMLDMVFNHTSQQHEWAQKAKAGDKYYQDFFHCFDNRDLPNQFDQSMPEIFPETAPGNFTYIPKMNQWVMTVFHHYQWDLNYSNPDVLVAMLDNVLFAANIGVDFLRIDAPAFIWKQLGTSCQNLPQAHTLLKLLKQCVQVASPGMALLGEAIVAPYEIIKYFGTNETIAEECDVAYNATQMALQWDALATGDTRVMRAAQDPMMQKPYGCTWITYTRCHDDIGLAYDDTMIEQAGFNAYQHRTYLKNYFAGVQAGSPSAGALFSVNPKTGDARISGSLASLCGLEKAIEWKNDTELQNALKKIILMQAHSMFMGGIPMLFYGDELAYTNDYSYLQDAGKNYDNRWMHRPIIDWDKNEKRNTLGSFENHIFLATKKLIATRKSLALLADVKNTKWMPAHNIHIAGFVRSHENKKLYCIFNYKDTASYLTWYAFKEHGERPSKLLDHWTGQAHKVGNDQEYFVLAPYSFAVLEAVD